jgi:uncharacterized protein YjbI with pentapeptide repeats
MNAESTCAFNEDLARRSFGNDFIDELKQKYQKRPDKRGEFCGDWFQLSLLLKYHSSSSSPFGVITGKKFGETEVCNCMFCQHFWDWNGIHLENADLSYINLQYTDLQAAHLEKTNLSSTNLAHSLLAATMFTGAYLSHTNLEEAFLKDADFSNVDLQYSNFHNSILYDTNFNGADIRNSYGIVFDESKINKTHFDSEPTDPWSRLRKEYSGTKFFIHLILLVTFFLPFIVKIPLLTFISNMTNQSAQLIRPIAVPMQPAFLSLINYPNENTFTVWIFFGFTLVMILYNVLRGYLTYKVGLLRDAEGRSDITPKRREYYGSYQWFRKDIKFWRQLFTYLLWQKEIYNNPNDPNILELQFRVEKQLSLCKRWYILYRNFPSILYALHRLAYWLGWIAMVGFAIRIGYWLFTTWVPVSL